MLASALVLALAPPIAAPDGLLLPPVSGESSAATPREPCAVSDAEPCRLRLRGPGSPEASSACSSEPWSRHLEFTLPDRWVDSNGDGWWETVLRIALDPVRECGCARIGIDFEEAVHDWAVDVGDSPTNNGYGGDDGSTPDAAEVQVWSNRLDVYSALVPGREGAVDTLQQIELPSLGGRRLELVVCEQSLEVLLAPGPSGGEPLRVKLETPQARLLFALAGTDSGSAPAGAGGGDIFAAFNRVIHDRHATADKRRVGSGVRQVELSLKR